MRARFAYNGAPYQSRKRNLVRRLVTVMCFAAIGIAAPAGAWAVNVSSNDGNGTQNPTHWYSNGADLSGILRSTHGNPVYYSGKVDISLASDQTIGRYTSNTSSTSYVSRGGTVSYFPIIWPSEFQGVEARVCRDQSFVPDPCGSWSNRMEP